ncbi:MAG: hypothetical protein LBH46_00390 [Rickettsiales bacterium]|jgi:hypothetical protein|nr:hypothetical protein [Rickettsiales bacterium]
MFVNNRDVVYYFIVIILDVSPCHPCGGGRGEVGTASPVLDDDLPKSKSVCDR